MPRVPTTTGGPRDPGLASHTCHAPTLQPVRDTGATIALAPPVVMVGPPPEWRPGMPLRGGDGGGVA